MITNLIHIAFNSIFLSTFFFVSSVSAASSHTVLILHHSFEPDSVHVSPGDTVRWLHQDGAAHTVTGNGTEIWDSDYMAWGDVYLRVFINPGSHDYVCLYHPMFGKIVVGGSTGIGPIRPESNSESGRSSGSETSVRHHDALGRKATGRASPYEAFIRATPH